ncbi:hypothetical protein G6O67_001918 [Ophiocordyceps sinensis]|nr:hypothetical protein G6O67_001918 [Ophiocordyceps sinensis]
MANSTSDVATKVRDMMQEGAQDGLRYLEQGTYSFTLANGARLTVYASPFTPDYGGWAFQYKDGKHDFEIPRGVDIAMTHGPPRGILDYARNAQHAGCNTLFQAIHSAKPKVHCFGHIHEAWGCKLASWKDLDFSAARATSSAGGVIPVPTSENSIDAANSRLSTLKGLANMCRPLEGPFGINSLGKLVGQQSIHVDLTEGDSRLEPGRQTLFVNASICDTSYQTCQRPFLVDVYLDKDEGQEELRYESTDNAIIRSP